MEKGETGAWQREGATGQLYLGSQPGAVTPHEDTGVVWRHFCLLHLIRACHCLAGKDQARCCTSHEAQAPHRTIVPSTPIFPSVRNPALDTGEPQKAWEHGTHSPVSFI